MDLKYLGQTIKAAASARSSFAITAVSDFGHNNNRRDFFIGSFACYFYILHCSG